MRWRRLQLEQVLGAQELSFGYVKFERLDVLLMI